MSSAEAMDFGLVRIWFAGFWLAAIGFPLGQPECWHRLQRCPAIGAAVCLGQFVRLLAVLYVVACFRPNSDLLLFWVQADEVIEQRPPPPVQACSSLYSFRPGCLLFARSFAGG